MSSEESEHTRRWCINIDIEGFSKKYQVKTGNGENEKKGHASRKDVIYSFHSLVKAVYNIGTKVYGKTGIVREDDSANRLFAHQIGDGFQIVSELNNDIDRAVAIAIALMRQVLATGCVAKAGIALGDFQDIRCYYPQNVIEKLNDGRVPLGSGIMTITPVMGTAWIFAIETAKQASGSLLLISSECKNLLTPQFDVKKINDNTYSVNWLKGESDLVTKIMQEAGLEMLSEQQRIDAFNKYLKDSEQIDLYEKWIKNTCFYQGID